jgi:hypothetical protein
MPAFAANEFYLVQDTASKKCSIVEKKPAVSSMTVVGLVHKTKIEAETAMKGRQELRRAVASRVAPTAINTHKRE